MDSLFIVDKTQEALIVFYMMRVHADIKNVRVGKCNLMFRPKR